MKCSLDVVTGIAGMAAALFTWLFSPSPTHWLAVPVAGYALYAA